MLSMPKNCAFLTRSSPQIKTDLVSTYPEMRGARPLLPEELLSSIPSLPEIEGRRERATATVERLLFWFCRGGFVELVLAHRHGPLEPIFCSVLSKRIGAIQIRALGSVWAACWGSRGKYSRRLKKNGASRSPISRERNPGIAAGAHRV